ncbi:MAG: glycosyltransferase family 2 protein [Elainellaceae cyanobacterium]
MILIVIVNYRTPKLTIDCLHSLVAEVQRIPRVQVVVSDNASGDDSVEVISDAIDREGWHDWVQFMPLDKNGGFAYGNNAVIRKWFLSENPLKYVWLLNPDTVVRPHALEALSNFLDSHQDVGIVGSRLEDPDGTPQRSAFRFHTIFSELDLSLRLGLVSKLLSHWVVAPPVVDHDCQVDWVAGASMLVRREVFEDIGLMDDNYFMYYEEMDFCLAANRAGWPCWYIPSSRVVHLVGQSSGVTNDKRPPKRRPQYWFDSRRRYFKKNYGRLYAELADYAWIFGYSLWSVRRIIQQKPRVDPPQFFSDFLRNSFVFKLNSHK